ncbi:chaperonin 10-like protein [Spinellus fusiger]|nr:chaperonin 10-like protein [Spinellus fusiger]
MSSDTFNGWACSAKGVPVEWSEFTPKTFDDDSVEMNVTHCGICGSDIHAMDSGWRPTLYPCVTGHEITGVCTRIGKNVTNIKIGDRIGVGAQSGACLECEDCKSGRENNCPTGYTSTYNSRWKNGDKSYGGYADKWRGHYHFVHKIPENLSSEDACTFLCAGVTTYIPLKKYNVKPGDKVGVVGVGGLGHFAIQWAKAMGATTVALSHSDRKRDDAAKLGCDDYIVTTDIKTMQLHEETFTHLLVTHLSKDFDWELYFDLLKTNSYFIIVDIPDYPIENFPAKTVVFKQISVVGSVIGSPAEIRETLEFAATHNVKPWITKYPMKEAPEAIIAMRDGKARYRFVLEN